MKKISDEDLIGFLLGALEPSEEVQIQSALEESIELRERLSAIEDRMAQLPSRFVEIDPPKGLADKTMNTISIVDASLGSDADQVELAKQTQAGFSNTGQSGNHELRHRNGNWSVWDVVVGAVVCFVVAALLLPSIANSRFQSNLAQCQNNLRTIGYNLGSLAESFDGRFVIPQDADQWQASLFVQRMIDAGLTRETSSLICPNDPGKTETAKICQQVWEPVLLITPEDDFATNGELAKMSDHSVVETERQNVFRSGDWVQCSVLRKSEAASGSYGFPAPQVTAGQQAALIIPGSRNNVLCADAACFDNPGYRSRNHGGRGQNVLLGDLSVDYICDTACLPTGDHIYTNSQGQVQPGLFPGDNLIYRGVLPIENLANRR